MISGTINAKVEAVISVDSRKVEAVISVEVIALQGPSPLIEAVLDTGYSGFLTLPQATATVLGLKSVGDEQVTLADGREVFAAVCPANLVWDGQPCRVDVDVLETAPLVGMSLMNGYELNARILVGGAVTLTACE